MRFKVIDRLSGQEADPEAIALNEPWAKGLIYCDMEGFAILDDGSLMLVDECGQHAYCPVDRFDVVILEPGETSMSLRDKEVWPGVAAGLSGDNVGMPSKEQESSQKRADSPLNQEHARTPEDERS